MVYQNDRIPFRLQFHTLDPALTDQIPEAFMRQCDTDTSSSGTEVLSLCYPLITS